MEDVLEFAWNWIVYFVMVFGAFYVAGSIIICDFSFNVWDIAARALVTVVSIVVSCVITIVNT